MNEEEKPKTKRGGARPGSGPKPKAPEDKRVKFGVCFPPPTFEKLEKLRGKKGRSKYLAQVVEGKRLAPADESSS